MTYDSADAEVVLLEEVAPYNLSALTWVYSNGTWTNDTATAGIPPSSPIGGAIAYDSQDGYVIQFGGLASNGSTFEQGTWAFRGGAWSLIPGVSPDPRFDDLMTYDSADQQAVLVGGFANASGNPRHAAERNDTWVYSRGNWTNVTNEVGPSSPPPPGRGALVFDPIDNYSIFLTVESNRPVPWANQTWLLGTALPPFASVGVGSAPLEAGEPYNISVRTVTVAPPLTYNYVTLPPGCVSANVSELKCTTPVAGTYKIVVEITDSEGVSATAMSHVTLLPSISISRFTITPAQVHLGSNVRIIVNVTGGIPPYTLSYTGLPSGCANQNSPSYSCTPALPDLYGVSVVATDAVGFDATNRTNLSVYSHPSIATLTLSESWIDLGGSVTATASVVGGAPPIVYSYTNLPPGCPPATTGPILECTPSSVGEFAPAVTATDSLGATVSSGGVALRVGPDPEIASLTVSPSVDTVDLPIVVSIDAVGGVTPLQINWTGLPAGCAGSGTSFSCVPSIPGTFSVGVKIVDTLGHTANATAQLVVNPQSASPKYPTLELVAGGGIAGAFILGVAVWVYQRRRRRPPSESGLDARRRESHVVAGE